MLDPRVHAHHASAFRPHSVQLAAQLAQLHLCEPHALHTATPGRMKSGEHENIHTHPKATGVGHGHLEGCACDHRWDSGWPPKARDLRARAVVLAYHEIEQRRVSGGAARRQRANQPQRRQVLNRHRLLLCDAGWACPQVGVSSRSRPPTPLPHTHSHTHTHTLLCLSLSLTHTHLGATGKHQVHAAVRLHVHHHLKGERRARRLAQCALQTLLTCDNRDG